MLRSTQNFETETRTPSTRMPEVIDRINNVEISERTLADGVDALAELSDEARNNFELRMIALINRLRNEHARSTLAITALAMDFRLRALSRVLEATVLPDCEIDLASRCAKISGGALRVACEEPLIRDDSGLASFDKDRFKKRLLN